MPDDQPKLMNVIVTFDVYCVAIDGEAAEAAVLDLIRSSDETARLNPSHRKALPLVVSPVQPAWRDERPIVADDISDAFFEQLKGKTTQQAYDLLMKRPKP